MLRIAVIGAGRIEGDENDIGFRHTLFRPRAPQRLSRTPRAGTLPYQLDGEDGDENRENTHSERDPSTFCGRVHFFALVPAILVRPVRPHAISP